MDKYNYDVAKNYDYRNNTTEFKAYSESSAYSFTYTPSFINESNLEFKDIDSELYRVYVYSDYKITINYPLKLNVSATGGHRVFDHEGISHYIKPGWKHLYWKSKPNYPNFRF